MIAGRIAVAVGQIFAAWIVVARWVVVAVVVAVQPVATAAVAVAASSPYHGQTCSCGACGQSGSS